MSLCYKLELMRKTFIPRQKDIERKWLLVDAKGKTLGRLASQLARILQGKHRPIYTPHLLCGDRVVVINSRFIRVSGKKAKEKIYDKYSGYPSGRKEITFEMLHRKNPTRALQLAVKGMLPKNKLARKMLLSLRIYAEAQHPHKAQRLERIDV